VIRPETARSPDADPVTGGESALGVTTEICGACDGTGAEPAYREVPCPRCKGRGCEACGGSGFDVETIFRRRHLEPPAELLAAVLDLDDWIDFSQPMDDPAPVPDAATKEAWATLGRAVEAYRASLKAAASSVRALAAPPAPPPPKCKTCGDTGYVMAYDQIEPGISAPSGEACPDCEGPPAPPPETPAAEPEEDEPTEAELAEWWRLDKAATPAPWVAELSMRDDCSAHYAIRTVAPLPEHPHSPRFVAWMTGLQRDYIPPSMRSRFRFCDHCQRGYWEGRTLGIEVREDPQVEADARLYVLLRNALPRLLRALRRARSR
jgi:hypothetical protein